MKKIFSKIYVRYGLAAIGGIFIGWLFFHTPDKTEERHKDTGEQVKTTIWTCSMHPHIRMHEPGKCPICGMDIIPITHEGTADTNPDAIHLSKDAAALANVMTTVVTRQKPIKEVRLYGKVKADERLLQNQVAHLPGRIEKLMVNFTGEFIRKGQPLAIIYSPELITAQQELLEASRMKGSQSEIYEAAKEKLRLWKITDKQIDIIERSENVQSNFEIVSNTTGIVSVLRVNTGDYVAQGTVLFDIVDLSHLWVLFDAYESDLPFITMGDKLTFTVQSLPGTIYSGKIDFIDPVIDPLTRVAKLRVEINNEDGKLKPEMFATGIIKANLEQYSDNLAIPRSAVLWTGKRSIVYVKQEGTDEPVFKVREIGLGPLLGNSYIVTDGLNEGEEIVTAGTFSIDAAAQLEGKPSMMSFTGGNKNPLSGKDAIIDTETSIKEDAKKSEISAIQNMQHASFGVSGNCEMCKERIEMAAKSIKGVTVATWDVGSKKISLEFNSKETNLKAINKAIANAGHDTESERSPDSIYKELPECCLYTRKKP
jgi:Cu(I)/Ag(I) efflux system membrane fusion protein